MCVLGKMYFSQPLEYRTGEYGNEVRNCKYFYEILLLTCMVTYNVRQDDDMV